ncbi:MAG: cyanophycinase [Bacteroidetes bacterium]|nr:cyanophycinase [Bacteroidota bacterium]
MAMHKLILFQILLTVFPFYHAISQGNLVIAGGGTKDDNVSIYSQLIGFAGGSEKATFAFIPSASGVAMQSYAAFKSTLVSYGVKPENIYLIPIALIDDDSTKDADESSWKNNGNDLQLADLVRKCSAVWFSGGDQTRTTKALYKPDGSRTPVLEAVWEVFNSGGVIGGTSAGAAIMCDPMIGGGNSLSALTKGIITGYTGDDFPESDGLLMTRGLGFFPAGMIDQHVDARGRLGRLIVALIASKDKFHFGFGIDENTALVYESNRNFVKIAGEGGVTIFDISGASVRSVDSYPCIENIRIHYLENGDSFDLASGNIQPQEGKKSTIGNEYYNIENPGQAGIFSGYSAGFHDLITINLLDNKGTDRVQNLSFFDEHQAFQITLYKTAESKGFYTDEPDDKDHYTVVNVQMDLVPVQISVSPLKK